MNELCFNYFDLQKIEIALLHDNQTSIDYLAYQAIVSDEYTMCYDISNLSPEDVNSMIYNLAKPDFEIF